MIDFLNEHWQLNIILGGGLIALCCSLLSTYVVLRRMAMLSEGVAHSSIGGIGVALLLAYYVPLLDNPYIIQLLTAVFCVATALVIGYIARSKRVSEDSAIGIFLVATVALGTLLVQYRIQLDIHNVPVSLDSVLFGHMMSMTATDTINAGVVALICASLVWLLYHELLYTTLDEEMARVNGVNTRLTNTLLQCMIAVTVVVGVRMVGALMIVALMVLPGATANMLSRRFGQVMAASLVIGTLGSLAGLGAAFGLAAWQPDSNYSPGPILVLVLFAIFLAVWVARHLFKPRVEQEAGR